MITDTRLYKLYKKVPGGSVLVPMIVFAAINTLFPNLLDTFGGMTAALFKNGALVFASLILFATGTEINISTLGTVFKRSGVLAMAKLLISFGAGILFIRCFGMSGKWGINTIAFVTCMCSCNPGIFILLMQDYGEPADMGNFLTLNILAMPCFPLLVLAMAGGGGFRIMDIITVLVPFVLGLICGNLNPALSKLYKATTPIVIPFMGCCFGASINLVTTLRGGIPGVLLAVIYLAAHLLIMLPADRKINKRPGYASTSMCSINGLALAVPAMLSAQYGATAMEAVSQIALCLFITSIASMYITRLVVKRWGCAR